MSSPEDAQPFERQQMRCLRGHHRSFFDCPRGSCWMTAFIRSFSLTRINDDRQVAHGLFDELFGTMARRRIEEQCVTRPHHVATVSVPITDFAREHIKKFNAGVTKMSIGKRVFAERDQMLFNTLR